MKLVHFRKFWNFEICKQINKLWWKSKKKMLGERTLQRKILYYCSFHLWLRCHQRQCRSGNSSLVKLLWWPKKNNVWKSCLYSPKSETLKEEVRKDLLISKSCPQSQHLAKFMLEAIAIVCMFVNFDSNKLNTSITHTSRANLN